MDRFRGPDINDDLVYCPRCERRFIYDEGVIFEGEYYCSDDCSGGVLCTHCEELKNEDDIVDVKGVAYCTDCGYISCIICGEGFHEEDGVEDVENVCSEKCIAKMPQNCMNCDSKKRLEGKAYCSPYCRELLIMKKEGGINYVFMNDFNYLKGVDVRKSSEIRRRLKEINFRKLNLNLKETYVYVHTDDLQGYKYIIGLTSAVRYNRDKKGKSEYKLLYNINLENGISQQVKVIEHFLNSKNSFNNHVGRVMGLFKEIRDLRKNIDKYK